MDRLYSEEEVTILARSVATHGMHDGDCSCSDSTGEECSCGYAAALELALRMTQGDAGPMTGWSVTCLAWRPETGGRL